LKKIFVSLYNKNPRWKIPDPIEFVGSTIEKIVSLWKIVKEYQTGNKEYGNNEVSAALFNLNEALVAISNIVTFQASQDLLMSEDKMTPIAALLNEKRTRRIEDPYVVNLKMTAISIFVNMARPADGANKLLENPVFIKNGLSLLRCNTKEGSTLIGALLRIISNMTLHSHLKQVLVNVGIWIVLLKVVLKTEIHPKVCRKEALRLFLNIFKSFDHDSKPFQAVEMLFPENIKKLFVSENDLEVILNCLDNGSNTPKIIWTKLMRYEVLYTVGTELDKVCYHDHEKLGDSKVSENKAMWPGPARMHPPIFPEIQENLCINGIYLRNFNKNPIFDDDDKPSELINNIADYGDMIYDEFLEKTITYEKSGSFTTAAMSMEHQKKLDRLSCAMVTILTSLLLCMDRFIYPPVKKSKSVSETPVETPKAIKTGAKDFDESVAALTKNAEESLEDKPILFIFKCMELFEQPKIHFHILSTMFQILYLLADDKNGFAFLRSNNIIQFFANFLLKLTPDYQGQIIFSYVEEKIGLYFLLKILIKDQDLIPEATALCLDYLEQINFGPKSYLRDIIQIIIKVLDEYSDPERDGENLTMSVTNKKTILNAHFTLADVWKPISQGFNPYQIKNSHNALRKKAKDSELVYPVLSDFSFISLPHMSVENIKHEQIVKNYVARMIEENSNSKDCMYSV